MYTFKQPTREILAGIVTDIAKKEGYSLERSAAELVALLAEGSFRDALGILQKVLAVTKDKKIDVAEVEAVSGAPRGEIVRQILSGLAKKDAPLRVEGDEYCNGRKHGRAHALQTPHSPYARRAPDAIRAGALR